LLLKTLPAGKLAVLIFLTWNFLKYEVDKKEPVENFKTLLAF
jgi:hypothetical protein